MFISNLESTGNHKAWKLSSETRNVSAFVSYPLWAKPHAPVTLAFQEQNITTLHKEKTTKRRLFWSGLSRLDQAVLDLQYSLNSGETYHLQSHCTVLKRYHHQKQHSVLSTVSKNCLFIFAMVLFSWGHLSSSICWIWNQLHRGETFNRCGEIYYCNALLATISQHSDLLAYNIPLNCKKNSLTPQKSFTNRN